MDRVLYRLVLLLGALLLLAEAAHANGYATDNRGYLYQVSPETKKFTRLGQVIVRSGEGEEATETRPVLTDLALSVEHGLYGISYNELFRIDVTDPSKSRRVGPLEGGYGFNALAFEPEGQRLYALNADTLYEVNLKNGAAKAIGIVGSGGGSDGDLAFVDGVLYGTFSRSDGSHLVRIDVKTGMGVDVGVIRRAAPEAPATPRKDRGPGKATPIYSVWGLIWDGQKTWALTSDGHILLLDLKTALATPHFRTPLTFHGACPMLRL